MEVEKIESSQVTLMVVVFLAVFLVLGAIVAIQSYLTRETEAFLAAGCDYVLAQGRAGGSWVNCKCRGDQK